MIFKFFFRYVLIIITVLCFPSILLSQAGVNTQSSQILSTEDCTNGIDDDGDGLIDCADTDCLSCNSKCGPVPSLNPKIFNTGNNGKGGLIPVGAKDLHWTVSNSLNGTSREAIYTGNCATGEWTPSPYPDAGWITDPQYGVCGNVVPQFDSTRRFFSTSFTLSPTLAGSLKLSFDVYADNYVSEVFLNGIPQGINKAKSDVYCRGCNISFTLNKGFVTGTNTLTILVSQRPIPEQPLGQLMGLLLNASASLDSDGDGVADGVDQCPGTPTGVSVDANGCFAVSIQAIKTLCEGESMILESSNAGAGSIYKWTTPDGQELFGRRITRSNVKTSFSGKYNLEITDMYGCIRTDFVDITIRETPAVVLNSNATVCRGETLQLSAVGGTNYTWTPSQGLSSANIANPKANPLTTTTYQVAVTNSFGCKQMASTTITVKQPDIITTSSNVVICPGGKTQLNVTGGTTYQWSPATGLNNSTIANPIASPTTTTPYKIVIGSANGCKDSTTVTVTVNDTAPPITITPNSFICLGDSIQLTASGGGEYEWVPATGLSNATIANPKASPDHAISYQVYVKNNNGCISSASTQLNVRPKVIASVTPSMTICERDTIQLRATGGSVFSWESSAGLSNSNISNPKAFPLITTVYKVIVADDFGCKDSATTVLTVLPKSKLSLGGESVTCINQPIELNASLPNAISYLWSTGVTDASIKIKDQGMYYVRVAINGCLNPVTDSFFLTVQQLPKVSLGRDTSICDFSPVTLKAEGTDITKYTWNTGSWENSISVSKEGLYSVIASNECGEAKDDVYVKVNICSEDLSFPNAFTPNSDGRNEVFKALYLGGIYIHEFSLKIYNRWGTLVFESNDPHKGWDGLYGGSIQKTDVFIWYVTYRKNSTKQKVVKKGTVTLLK